MLTWTRSGDTWLGNGFRIEMKAARQWVLYDVGDKDESSLVSTTEALASLPTLSAAKYKAEHVHQRRRISASRQRLGSVVVGASALAAFFSAYPMAVAAFGVVAVSALLELVMTWFDDGVGGANELTQ